MKSDETIRLTFKSANGADADIALSDFLKQAEAVQMALQQFTDGVDVCIVDVSMNSPITLILEPRRSGNPISGLTEQFVAATRDAFVNGVASKNVGRKFFEALHDFQSVVGKGIASTLIAVGNDEISVDAVAQAKFGSILRTDTIASGCVDGMLESVNLHNKRNTCNLYPEIGSNRITCKFTGEIFDNKVRPALGRYVQVYGELKYRWRDPLPYEVIVSNIDVLDGEELPNFSDIIGMAPNATGGKLSEEFVRDLRDGWR